MSYVNGLITCAPVGYSSHPCPYGATSQREFNESL